MSSSNPNTAANVNCDLSNTNTEFPTQSGSTGLLFKTKNPYMIDDERLFQKIVKPDLLVRLWQVRKLSIMLNEILNENGEEMKIEFKNQIRCSSGSKKQDDNKQIIDMIFANYIFKPLVLVQSNSLKYIFGAGTLNKIFSSLSKVIGRDLVEEVVEEVVNGITDTDTDA